VVWVLLSAAAVRDANGKASHFVGHALDITARKQMKERQARNAFILSQVRDSVIVTDLDGVVTYWNEGSTQLFGWRAEEMVGRPLIERVPPGGPP
jgi:two-component system, cell cycle sensor histidine kinase and response regulator CckA